MHAEECIIALSETWYSRGGCEPPALQGYQGFHVMAGRGRGISLFLKIPHQLANQPHTFNEQHLQIIKTNLSKFTILLVYRSPAHNSFALFMQELIKILPNDGPTIVCGDFNIHPKEDNSCYDTLVEKMASKGFLQHIDRPTHKEGNILDHFYVRDINTTEWQFHHPYYSDHEAICYMAKI